MAKKNGRDDPPKPQVAENEQMSDIILILDKMELILQAVSQIDKDGRYKTVPADKEHTNSFLKIDRYASMFENFLKNFWSQLKDPTRFGILSVKEKALDDPKVRQAIEDLAAGKKTDAVEEFLKQYEIVPRDKENQSINHQNQEEMAKENETQQQAAQGGGTQQQPQYRYNESMINWEQLKNFGLSREELQERGLLDQMLRGYKTNQVVPISMNFAPPYYVPTRGSRSSSPGLGTSYWASTVSGRNPTSTVPTSDTSSLTRTRRTCLRRATWGVSWN